MKLLCNLSDLGIEREGHKARLFNGDGDCIAIVPSTMTDGDISHVVRVANNAFNDGYELGAREARREIRAALGIEPL